MFPAGLFNPRRLRGAQLACGGGLPRRKRLDGGGLIRLAVRNALDSRRLEWRTLRRLLDSRNAQRFRSRLGSNLVLGRKRRLFDNL
jgi:hypothetical protein